MLLHAAIQWPEALDPTNTLWTLAVCHATWIYNCIPSINTGLSSMDLWARITYSLRNLHFLHGICSPQEFG